MSELIAGSDIGIYAFLNLEDNASLGICIFHEYGASHVSLEEFIFESKVDLSKSLCQRYACAFEIMAKQLREE